MFQTGQLMFQDAEPAIQVSVHQLAESLGRAMAVKAMWARTHSEEVARVGEELALAMNLAPGVGQLVHLAGHLHDIGKIGIPDFILHKPDRLNQEEYRIIQEHSAMGEAIVRPVMVLDRDISVPDIVRHHHERFDGSGYPDGLRGHEIPIGARIIAVADSLSAMLQDRPYKSPMDFDAAVAELRGLAGIWYDPEVTSALLRIRERVRAVIDEARDAVPLSCGSWGLCELGPAGCAGFEPGLRDPLTGLYSRRYFDQFLTGVLSGSLGGPLTGGLCLAFIDCDHFRDFNEVHGQECGDRVLARLGRIIQSSVRDTVDYPFRYARDVFGVAFRQFNLQACARVCERIRRRFEDEGGCTVSVGLAVWEAGMGCDGQALITACRRALNRAKKSGRNRVFSVSEHGGELVFPATCVRSQ